MSASSVIESHLSLYVCRFGYQINVRVCVENLIGMCVLVGGLKPAYPILPLSFGTGGAGERASGGGIKYPDVRRKAAEHRNMKCADRPSPSAPHPL